MKKGFHDHSPRISLTVLATLCFVTLIMCQTRFRVTKEINEEISPPVIRSKDYWFLYSIGNPDRFQCVLKAFIEITSPILSLISTGLLIFGKIESNPYLFLPWLFLTIKGLLLVQTDNIITLLRDMGNKANYVFGFRMEDIKWILFYGTIFMIDLVEAFSFCEIFDLFLVLWNHHPGYNVESATLEAVKREIADIMEALSKCSLGSLSKISLSSAYDSEENVCDVKKLTSRVKFSSKEDEKVYDENEPPDSLLKRDSVLKNLVEENFKSDAQNSSLNSASETPPTSEVENPTKCQNGEFDAPYLTRSPKMNLKLFSKIDLREQSEKTADGFPMESYSEEFHVGAAESKK